MKLNVMVITSLMSIFSTQVLAVICEGKPDSLRIECKFEPIPQQQCLDDTIAKINYLQFCAPTSKICELLENPNECQGQLSQGHWFVTGFEDGSLRRCQC